MCVSVCACGYVCICMCLLSCDEFVWFLPLFFDIESTFVAVCGAIALPTKNRTSSCVWRIRTPSPCCRAAHLGPGVVNERCVVFIPLFIADQEILFRHTDCDVYRNGLHVIGKVGECVPQPCAVRWPQMR